jgi:hypothetical protein
MSAVAHGDFDDTDKHFQFLPDGTEGVTRVKERRYRMTYNSAGGNHFTVHKNDSTNHLIKESDRGLHYCDTNKDQGCTGYHDDNMWCDGMVMVNTVANKKSNYMNRAYSRAVAARNIQKMMNRAYSQAVAARNIQKMIVCPSTTDLSKLLITISSRTASSITHGSRGHFWTRHRKSKGQNYQPKY